MSQEESFCEWYSHPNKDSSLDKFIKERAHAWSVRHDCYGDTQSITAEYIRCVKLSDIVEKEPWSKQRTEDIRKWATPDLLRTLKVHDNNENETVAEVDDIPRIGREVKIGKSPEKFVIGNGIHRINEARRLGLDCILCHVFETIVVQKEDPER